MLSYSRLVHFLDKYCKLYTWLVNLILKADDVKIDFRGNYQRFAQAHRYSQFGARDIDSWMLDVLQLQKGLRILDVGCGAGKQCFSFHQHLDGDVEITGTDVSGSLLAQARQENALP